LNKGGRDFRIPAEYQDGAPIHVDSFATLPQITPPELPMRSAGVIVCSPSCQC
jgi:hypothetical protein